jgi:hypothetical protein
VRPQTSVLEACAELGQLPQSAPSCVRSPLDTTASAVVGVGSPVSSVGMGMGVGVGAGVGADTGAGVRAVAAASPRATVPSVPSTRSQSHMLPSLHVSSSA